MFAKQIPNGRLLPKKIWHLPSLSDELYTGLVSLTNDIRKRKLVVDTSRHPETPKYGEVSRFKCTIWDRENDESVAEGFQITNQNNKKSIEITEWHISTNAEYIFNFVKIAYAKDQDKAKLIYDKLVQKWDIPNPDFDKDILSSLRNEETKQIKEQAIFQSILFNLEKFIVPLFNKSAEFDDETKFERLILDALSKLGYQYSQFGGFENPLFKQVWDEYGLNEQGQVIQTKEWSKTFAGIFLNLKEEIHHKRIRRSNSGLSSQHMTKWGPMSEPEGDGWED